MADNQEDRTCYVCNFAPAVTTDLLEELFTQVGPVEKVTVTDRSTHRFAMVEFEDEESVPFAVKTLDGINLFNTPIRVKPRNGSKHESAYKSAINKKRRESCDGSNSAWYSSTIRRDTVRESYDGNGSGHMASSHSTATLRSPTPPLQSSSSRSVETRSISPTNCDSNDSVSSKFSGRPDGNGRRTFPTKPSDSRTFESGLDEHGKNFGNSRGKPYSSRDSRYSDGSSNKSPYSNRDSRHSNGSGSRSSYECRWY